MSDRSARLKEMQERQEELESNNKRLQQEEQDLREKYHEVWILTCSSLQPRTKPVDTHYKNTYFLHSSSQKISANWKPVSRFPYSNVVCSNTRNAQMWTFRPKQLWTRIGGGGGGGGRFLFPLEMIVVLREITKHMEMSNELCPGL